MRRRGTETFKFYAQLNNLSADTVYIIDEEASKDFLTYQRRNSSASAPASLLRDFQVRQPGPQRSQ